MIGTLLVGAALGVQGRRARGLPRKTGPPPTGAQSRRSHPWPSAATATNQVKPVSAGYRVVLSYNNLLLDNLLLGGADSQASHRVSVQSP